MKKIHQLNQGNTGFCTAFACFGAIQYHFNRVFSNEYIFEICNKLNIKNDGNIARNVSRKIAEELGYKVKEVSISSQEFRQLKSKGHPMVVTVKVPRSFWDDAIDGDIDNYSNDELPGVKHTVFLVSDTSGDWIINSWGDKMKPLKVDLKQFKKSWWASVRAITFLQ